MIEEKQIDPRNPPNIQGFPSFVLQKTDGSTVPCNGPRSPDGWDNFLSNHI
jgi:hypothetical protein